MTNEEKAKQTAVELCGQHTAGSYTYLQTEKAALKVLEQDREQTELTQKIIEFET